LEKISRLEFFGLPYLLSSGQVGVSRGRVVYVEKRLAAPNQRSVGGRTGEEEGKKGKIGKRPVEKERKKE